MGSSDVSMFDDEEADEADEDLDVPDELRCILAAGSRSAVGVEGTEEEWEEDESYVDDPDMEMEIRTVMESMHSHPAPPFPYSVPCLSMHMTTTLTWTWT